MIKKIYLGGSALLIVGYLGWSLMGFEMSQTRESVPTVKASRSHSSSGRSRHGYYGGGGFSFGK